MGNTAGIHIFGFRLASFTVYIFRELSDPPRILSYLLQPSSLALPTKTISVYIQASFKTFGQWVADLANRWNEDFLPEIKQTVDMMVGSLQDFAGSENIEVQERVSLEGRMLLCFE